MLSRLRQRRQQRAADRDVQRFTDCAETVRALPQPDLVKVDVQGGELDVLQGGLGVIAGARCLVVELSLRQFYEAQLPQFDGIFLRRGAR